MSSKRPLSLVINELEAFQIIKIHLEIVVRPDEVKAFRINVGGIEKTVNLEATNIQNVALCGPNRQERISNHEFIIENNVSDNLVISFSGTEELQDDAFFGVLSISAVGASDCIINTIVSGNKCVCSSGFIEESKSDCLRPPFENTLCLKCQICLASYKTCPKNSPPVCEENFQVSNGKCIPKNGIYSLFFEYFIFTILNFNLILTNIKKLVNFKGLKMSVPSNSSCSLQTSSFSKSPCKAFFEIQVPSYFLQQIITLQLTLVEGWQPENIIYFKNQKNEIVKQFSIANRLDFPNKRTTDRRIIDFDFKFVERRGNHSTNILIEGPEEKTFVVSYFRVDHTTCPENSVYNSNDGCVCNEGYFKQVFNAGFQCSKCSIRCKICQSFSTCILCNTDAGFIPVSGQCNLKEGKMASYL